MNVLVVDDNDLNREIITELISDIESISIDEAENGQQACLMATDKDYDVIYMDIMMPILDGVSATKNIRQLKGMHSPPTIVAVTAKRFENQAAKFSQAGFDDYVNKPFSEHDITRHLKA